LASRRPSQRAGATGSSTARTASWSRRQATITRPAAVRVEDLVYLAGVFEVHAPRTGLQLADERAADEQGPAQVVLAEARVLARVAQLGAEQRTR
jgi:hypothetical protein